MTFLYRIASLQMEGERDGARGAGRVEAQGEMRIEGKRKWISSKMRTFLKTLDRKSVV